MSYSNQTGLVTQSHSHPSDWLPQEWIVTQQSVYSEQFIVQHVLEPPSEIKCSPFSHHLLCLLLDGGTRQITRFAGGEYDGKQQQGDIWLLPAGVSGFWGWECTDEVTVFILDPAFLRRIAIESNCLNPDRVELKPILQAHDPKLLNLSFSFLHEMQTNGLGGRLYNECLANQFAIHLLRHYCACEPVFHIYNGGLSNPALVQAIDYIHEHLDEKLTLDAIASHLNLSVYYFCTLFTQSMGISPYQYVLQQRVERVKYLLKTSPLPLSEIAVYCGFNDQTQMSKHFRKLTGMTPKAYRKGG
jgi:AraC family transcriptional regulator